MEASKAKNPRICESAKFLFAVYCASSKGKSWNGEPVPTWSEIQTRATERRVADGFTPDPDGIEPGSVNEHWYNTAMAAGAPLPGSTREQIAMHIENVFDGDAEYTAAFWRYWRDE